MDVPHDCWEGGGEGGGVFKSRNECKQASFLFPPRIHSEYSALPPLHLAKPAKL